MRGKERDEWGWGDGGIRGKGERGGRERGGVRIEGGVGGEEKELSIFFAMLLRPLNPPSFLTH